MVRLNIHDIIKYIKSLNRVGCSAFKFISQTELINQYRNTDFTLVEDLSYDSKLVNWENIKDYSPNITLKIDRKIKDKKLNLYYKNVVYNDVLKNPVVIGHQGLVIDGYHRLKNIQINKLSFNAWIATNYK